MHTLVYIYNFFLRYILFFFFLATQLSTSKILMNAAREGMGWAKRAILLSHALLGEILLPKLCLYCNRRRSGTCHVYIYRLLCNYGVESTFNYVTLCISCVHEATALIKSDVAPGPCNINTRDWCYCIIRLMCIVCIYICMMLTVLTHCLSTNSWIIQSVYPPLTLSLMWCAPFFVYK